MNEQQCKNLINKFGLDYCTKLDLPTEITIKTSICHLCGMSKDDFVACLYLGQNFPEERIDKLIHDIKLKGFNCKKFESKEKRFKAEIIISLNDYAKL